MGQTRPEDSDKPPGGVPLDETSLLPRHRQGDQYAFPELLECYRSPVYGYLVRCGIGASARDDLFQEIFAKIHRAAASYQSDRPLKPWLDQATVKRARPRTQMVPPVIQAARKAFFDMTISVCSRQQFSLPQRAKHSLAPLKGPEHRNLDKL